MKLTHNDDGKGKWQSHTVSADFGDYDIYTIEGYGETREEALEEFIIKFDIMLNKLSEFRKTLKNIPEMIEVDCSGKPLED